MVGRKKSVTSDGHPEDEFTVGSKLALYIFFCLVSVSLIESILKNENHFQLHDAPTKKKGHRPRALK